MFDVITRIGTLKFVERRNRVNLLPIIEEIVLPGTEIHSDCWPAYNAINAIPVIPNYIHKTVNHKNNFVDPITGVHTNNVENFWKNVKAKHKTMGGTSVVKLPTYLDEYIWHYDVLQA